MGRGADGVGVDDLWRCELHEELDALTQVQGRIRRIEGRLDAMNRSDARVIRLRTIPGVGGADGGGAGGDH